MASKKKYLFDTGLATLGLIAGMIATIVGGILTARYLGADGKGQVTLALSTGMMLAQIFCFGMDQASPYFIASRRLSASQVLGSWLLVFIFATLLVYGILYPLMHRYLMTNLFSGISYSVLLLGSLSCPIYMLRLLINGVLTGFEDFRKLTVHNVCLSMVSVAAAVFALALCHWKVAGYIAAQNLLGAGSLVLGFYLLHKVVSFRPVWSIRNCLSMLRYGVKSMLTQILSLIDLRLDLYLVNLFLETSFVGIYSVSASLGNIFWILPNSLVTTLFPRTAASDLEESKEFTSLLCRNALWATILFGGLFLLISKPLIVFVFGREFAPAAVALAYLMPGVAGQVVSRICFTDCSARGFPEKSTYATAITALTTIVLDILLIPRFGINGAALASSVAYCTGGLLGLYWHCRIAVNRPYNLLVVKSQDLSFYRKIGGRVLSKFRGYE